MGQQDQIVGSVPGHIRDEDLARLELTGFAGGEYLALENLEARGGSRAAPSAAAGVIESRREYEAFGNPRRLKQTSDPKAVREQGRGHSLPA